MRLKRLLHVSIIFVLVIQLHVEECAARGGGRGGGGGGRGGGGSKGIGGSRGSSGGGRGKGGKSYPTLNGRNVIGNYKSFGSPSRWSIRGGRSFYFVGFPYGHHHYRGGSYSRMGDEDGSGPVNPWIIMILILLGINMFCFGLWGIVYCAYKW